MLFTAVAKIVEQNTKSHENRNGEPHIQLFRVRKEKPYQAGETADQARNGQDE